MREALVKFCVDVASGAVTGALGAVLPQARGCLGPDDPISRAAIVFGSNGTVQSVSVTGAAAGTEVEACMADTGLDVLRHTGSDEATNDVDLLRAVLGEERINLLAYSYGTQIRCTRCAFLATTGPRFWTASSTSQNGRTTCAWGRNAAIRPRSPD